MRARSWIALIALVAALVTTVGCVSARRRADGVIVRRIEFEGNVDRFTSDQSDYTLRQQMSQRKSPYGILAWPVKYAMEGVPYRPGLLKRDWQSIETYYAHNGWFEARVEKVEVVEVRRERRRKAGVVDVTITVRSGPATFYNEDSPAFSWPDRTEDAPGLPILRRLSEIRGGGRFQLSQVRATEADIERHLRVLGFAWAEVDPEVRVLPEQRVAIAAFDVTSGPPATFGEVSLTGLDRVPEDVVREIAGITPGKPYDLGKVEDAEQELFRMGAFASVRVVPDLSSPGSAVVPVDVSVVEAKFRQLQIGGRLGYEGSALAPSLDLSYKNGNIGGRLVRFGADLRIGALFTRDGQRAPLFHLGSDWLYPRVFGPRWDLAWGASADMDLFEAALGRARGKAGVDVIRRFGRHVSASVGPHFRMTWIGIPSTVAESALLSSTYGLDFINPYSILSMDTTLSYDRVTDDAGVRRGGRMDLHYRRAFPVLSYAFHDVGIGGRMYLTPRSRDAGFDAPITLALRAEVRGLLGTGGEAVPYPERLFVGGSGSLRGFRAGQVGAYDCVCVPRPGVEEGEADSEGEIRRRYLPHGGLVTQLVGAELTRRNFLLPDLSGAVFAEAGTLGQRAGALLNPANLRIGAGAGVRYRSPVGPIRLDLAMRPIYREDAGPETYVGCEGVGPRRRAFDLLSEFDRRGPFGRRVPAVNLYISLGEAF